MAISTVPAAARSVIQNAFRVESDHADALPDPLPIGRILGINDTTKASREKMRILAGQDDEGFYLDFYRQENDDTTSWHGRIRDNGVRQSLENYEGQFGIRTSVDPAETERELQRVRAHNAHVHQVLTQKGFL